MSKPINSATKQAWHAIVQEAIEIEYEQNDDYLGMEKEDAIQLIKQEIANWSFAKFNRFVEENFNDTTFSHQATSNILNHTDAVCCIQC
ncbi:hypothetical protein P8629_02690 [Hydrogenovibrio sp. 3SP14C1]|uniref:hypothetical protein n=1 Tax=Hydrogenovibrio sp. 3SP14C1 TaxID=3038774 RepID=UPI00241631A6|nr:hypothetical protein [Hydrogenovibrio sp. 3SP14C1]MDG4811904.1 hypothetical protein [Hydrogenovibrio sp. 3SP14C1]